MYSSITVIIEFLFAKSDQSGKYTSTYFVILILSNFNFDTSIFVRKFVLKKGQLTAKFVLKVTYLPCEYVNLGCSGDILLMICSVTSEKFPAHLAYFANTQVSCDITAYKIGMISTTERNI